MKLLIFQNLEDNSWVQTTRALEDVRKAEVKIAEVAAGIAAGHFEPDPGRHCNWCAYRTICPAKETVAPSSVLEPAKIN